jgi:hypothetical protein
MTVVLYYYETERMIELKQMDVCYQYPQIERFLDFLARGHVTCEVKYQTRGWKGLAYMRVERSGFAE